MKSLKHVLWIFLLFSIVSCKENDTKVEGELDVETYIDLLKSSQYDSLNLPSFTYKHIPALLEYRNETQIITDFPHNPVSSLYEPECRLGMYVLWTIESIRAVSVDSEYLIMRFPSLNPILALRDSDGLDLVSDDDSHTIAAEAYYEWWENNSNRDFDDFNFNDPLASTDYKWH